MRGSKNKMLKVTYILVGIMVLALILSFDTVSNAAGNLIGVGGQVVNDIARTVLGVSIGLFLISSGVAALAVPVVGIALIAIGAVLVGYAIWPYLQRNLGSSE